MMSQKRKHVGEHTGNGPNDKLVNQPAAPKMNFLAMPLELREKIYASCIPWAPTFVPQTKQPWQKSLFAALTNAHPHIAKEFGDHWYSNNTFLLDARMSVVGGNGETKDAYAPPIAAWLDWLNNLESRQMGLLRKINIWTDFFVVKFRISETLREDPVDFEIRFSFEGSKLKSTTEAGAIDGMLRSSIESLNERMQGCRLDERNIKVLTREVMKLVPICCSSLQSEFGPNNSRLYIEENHIWKGCNGTGCRKLRRYLSGRSCPP